MTTTPKVLSAVQIHSIYEHGIPKGGDDPNLPRLQYRRVAAAGGETPRPKDVLLARWGLAKRR